MMMFASIAGREGAAVGEGYKDVVALVEKQRNLFGVVLLWLPPPKRL